MKVNALLRSPELREKVDREWYRLTKKYSELYEVMPNKHMQRTELSFHEYVKLLGYLEFALRTLEGSIVEIGVWKGKSLALMSRLSGKNHQTIGVDPCEIEGQFEELSYFKDRLFPNSKIVADYSQNAIEKVLDISTKIKLLHIDGNHARENVWMDFLMYERFVVPGGCVVFDDYIDDKYSPDVRPTVDKMLSLGLFSDYHVIGSVPEFENSYLLVKKRSIRHRMLKRAGQFTRLLYRR